MNLRPMSIFLRVQPNLLEFEILTQILHLNSKLHTMYSISKFEQIHTGFKPYLNLNWNSIQKPNGKSQKLLFIWATP
jgi:hypothetical protein